MFTRLVENIIKKDLLVESVSKLIPCHGYRYLSILTDGAFNPDPTYLNRLNHFILLKNTNRLIPIYGEMRNIPLGKNSEIRYSNLTRSAIIGDTVQNGYGYIYFYLSNYINDYMSIKGNIGFQYEMSFTGTTNTEYNFHFGINRQDSQHTLAIPFIANCYNKLIYLLKENNVSQTKNIEFYFEDNDRQAITLATNTLTELLLPAKRFIIKLKANAINPTDFDFIIKFEKA